MKTRHESGGFFLAARGGQAVLEPAGAAKKKRAPEGARVFHSEFGATAMPGGNRGRIKGFACVALIASMVLAQKANAPT